MFCTVVYGKSERVDRRELWDGMVRLGAIVLIYHGLYLVVLMSERVSVSKAR